jgi:uncharacterized protein YaeQ
MALGATIYHVEVNLSDVDRGVYEALDLRLARHPSESMRYMLTRVLGYCLSFEEGIAFSKGGLSAADEPPISIHDPTGVFVAWIDVGSPSAERLHKASKAARRVSLFSSADMGLLQREARSRSIHKIDQIAVWHLETQLLDALEDKIQKNTKIDLLHTDGQLYVTVGAATVEGQIVRRSLVE